MQFKLENNDVVSLTIVRKPNMKHIYLRVTPKGVLVSAHKKTKLSTIEAFVFSKSSWLIKHLKVQKAQNEKRLLKTGNNVYYQGEAIVLECQEVTSSKAQLEFLENKFIISMPKASRQEELEILFDNFYKEEAIKQIKPLLDKWSKIMDLKPSTVGFRKAKRRWGSCSSQNALSFNYYLMKLPLHLVEYVVVHELAHIKEKNHSSNFWAVLEEFLPEYKALVVDLREFERVL